MCPHIQKVQTKTKFVILMHPKEFKKVKNGTGHFTHLSLPNSELYIGIDFTNHQKINEIIATHESFVLYPSKNSINLSERSIALSGEKKDIAIFLIDATWACSVKMLRESKNLQCLKSVSFENTQLSQFKIKEQPAEYCLSTIESTLKVLELLNKWNLETIEEKDLQKFLNPFYKMIELQIKCIEDPQSNAVRYRKKR